MIRFIMFSSGQRQIRLITAMLFSVAVKVTVSTGRFFTMNNEVIRLRISRRLRTSASTTYFSILFNSYIVQALAAGYHGEYVAFCIYIGIQHKGTLGCGHLLYGILYVGGGTSAAVFDFVCLADEFEIGVHQTGLGETFVVE